MSTPFCPAKWSQHFRQLNAHTPARGSTGGLVAYYAELIGLYQELIAEVLKVQVTPADLRGRPHLVNVVIALDMIPPESGDMLADEPPTVPLRELTDLARIGLAMRRAQREFFEAKRERPNGNHQVAYRHARQSEDRFDVVARNALNRERESLPGMEDFGG